MEFENISLKEGIKLSKDKKHYILMDVREEERYKEGHLENAISCPYGILKECYEQMDGKKIIEALAQTGAVCALSADEYKGKIAFLGGVNKAKFRGKVVPGDVLTLEVEMIKVKGPVGVAQGTATVDGKKVASAEITFMIG